MYTADLTLQIRDDLTSLEKTRWVSVWLDLHLCVCVYNLCVCTLDHMFMRWNVCERANTCTHMHVCAFQKVTQAVNHTFLNTYHDNPRLNRYTRPHTHMQSHTPTIYCFTPYCNKCEETSVYEMLFIKEDYCVCVSGTAYVKQNSRGRQRARVFVREGMNSSVWMMVCVCVCVCVCVWTGR